MRWVAAAHAAAASHILPASNLPATELLNLSAMPKAKFHQLTGAAGKTNDECERLDCLSGWDAHIPADPRHGLGAFGHARRARCVSAIVYCTGAAPLAGSYLAGSAADSKLSPATYY